ncbi:MAG: xanthine dehydrogenase accessory protein XdhC [Candidatus Eisenbacteria bacterium]|uniref:Xanthine dehydrogenase accessory protein XdhC n=1 Tax=Eiseniibacteriota bacterium TaxID=2212470 RepID=A0A933S8K8_UNCEI|nr:xanthine dehydrogenase accessory protein XdhC [Candidatus Eisenbacteria bacterium]
MHAFGEAREPDVWEVLARWRGEGRRMAMLTVVESRGFTPQKAGTRMLVDAAGATAGTIGGGAIEHEALREARALLEAGGGAITVRKQLTQDLGMCCGGEMVVYIESLEAPPRLFLFGAGYIARPIAALATGCGFAVTVYDGRDEWAAASRFPGAAVHAQDPADAARALETTGADYAIVVTHDHDLDQRIVQELLRKPLKFTGMIGSLGKLAKFRRRLESRGFTPEQVARLRTPLGLPIGAQTPEEIAVSVLAELVAVRRETVPDKGWEEAARARHRRSRVADAKSTEGSDT